MSTPYSTIALLATSSALSAATLHVPVDYPTIQAAIDSAQSGDEVLVAPGTYHESFAFKEAPISVRSSDGPALTIIDGSQSQPYALAFFNMGTSGTLSGFTLREFYHPYSGAVTIKDASASIINCVFEDNQNNFGGSALRIETWSLSESAGAEVRNCTFRRNQSTEFGGAMSVLLLENESLVVSDCIFEENTAEKGGHLALNVNGPSGQVSIEQCAFRHGEGDIPAVYLINESIGTDGDRDINFASCTFEHHNGTGLHAEGEVALQLSNSTFVETGNPSIRLVSPSHAEISTSSFCGATVPITGDWTDLGGNSISDECICPGDGNADGMVNVEDLLHLIANFGKENSLLDFDGDGIVSVNDLLILISSWGPC